MRLSSFLVVVLFGLTACSTNAPDGITAVTSFEITRYAGKWYEIARLDHSFERELTDVSANYRQQDDGSVEVINRGFDTKRNEWREAIGKAKFTGDTNRASLKVSFFGPFYGGYHVVALDQKTTDGHWWLALTVITYGSLPATGSCRRRFANSCWCERANWGSIRKN